MPGWMGVLAAAIIPTFKERLIQYQHLIFSYIEVKVDVHKAVAFPIRAVVVELSNPPILLFDDLEARSVRLKSAIACMELTL